MRLYLQASWGASRKVVFRSPQLCVLPPLCLHPRRFLSSARVPPLSGQYARATEDVVFKHIMNQEKLRNSFLSAVLGQEVSDSEQLDSSLNPLKEYAQLRKIINADGIEEMMQEVTSQAKEFHVINVETKRRWTTLERFWVELARHYDQLLLAFPDPERNTQLDLVCKTEDGLINVEVQVEPQDFWDIRILAHVCGLFERQFPRSFKWNQLVSDPGISHKVKRAVGISIFEAAPKGNRDLRERLHWYDVQPWGKDEVMRHFRLKEESNNKLIRPGIEFFDINLGALSPQNLPLLEGRPILKEWLDLFANAHTKQPEEMHALTTVEVKEAYELVKIGHWDADLKNRYEKQQAMRYNISMFVEGTRLEGKLEGKLEGMLEGMSQKELEIASKMIKAGIADEKILEVTDLNADQLEALKANKAQ